MDDDYDDNNNNNSIQFKFINVSNQQPEGQLHKQHNIQTQITTDNIQNKIIQTQPKQTNKHTNNIANKQTITYLDNQ